MTYFRNPNVISADQPTTNSLSIDDLFCSWIRSSCRDMEGSHELDSVSPEPNSLNQGEVRGGGKNSQ